LNAEEGWMGNRDKKDHASASRGFSNRPSWVDKLGLLVAAASVVVAIFALGNGSGSSGNPTGSSRKTAARLNVVDVNLRDVAKGVRRYARLDVTLHNTGGQLAVVDGVRFEIERVYALPRCASQDDLPLNHVYGVSLPIKARPGSHVDAPLHQQIGSDDADRFGISLSTKRIDPTAVYLFVVDASLLNDGARGPVSLGRLLVSLPEMPLEGEYYWTEKTISLLSNWVDTEGSARELWAVSMPCWRSNTRIIERALDRHGARSTALATLADELVTPSLAAIE
jgi:hypothetical protein